MLILFNHQYPEIAHNLTCSVNLTFMRNWASKINVGLRPDSVFKMRPVYNSGS